MYCHCLCKFLLQSFNIYVDVFACLFFALNVYTLCCPQTHNKLRFTHSKSRAYPVLMQELCLVEFFAGVGNTWRTVRADSMSAVGVDLTYGNGNDAFDILTASGMAYKPELLQIYFSIDVTDSCSISGDPAFCKCFQIEPLWYPLSLCVFSVNCIRIQSYIYIHFFLSNYTTYQSHWLDSYVCKSENDSIPFTSHTQGWPYT